MDYFFATGGTLQVPFGIDFFSVAVGVLTGAIFACDRKLDIVGTVTLGLITGYGGGMLRDFLLQDHGVYFMEYPEVILICMGIAIFVFYFRGIFKHMGQLLFLADAFSVALFALAGANKAYQCGEGVVMVVILGALTSVGGGAIRDICVGETPSVFQRSNYYAVAGIAGSLVFAVLAFAGVSLVIAALGCVFTAVFLRYLSVYFDWKTSDGTDLSPKVAKGAHRVRHFFGEIFTRATLHRKTSTRRRNPLAHSRMNAQGQGHEIKRARKQGGAQEAQPVAAMSAAAQSSAATPAVSAAAQPSAASSRVKTPEEVDL